jgi:glycine cleavage system aminomethyltransferase T
LAERGDADLIVLGSTHRAHIGSVSPGSIAEHLLQGARCRLVIAPKSYAEKDHSGDRLRVLAVGYDGMAESQAALEEGAKLWDIIAEAGAPHGVIPAGIGVYGTTGRLEKCYRAYGAELEGDFTVVEAGMAWGKVKDQDFIGKQAHVAHRAADPAAILCTLTVDDHTSSSGVKRYILGHEPVLTPDGRPLVDRKGRLSYVTSAGAGPSTAKHILMSYLPPERANVGDQLSVEYMGERYPVTVAVVGATPLFDPENTRIRS